MEHDSSRMAQTAKKFPSLYENLQVISFQYHLPTTSFLRHITHIHTLNSYFFKILISIILPPTSMFLNQSLPFRFPDLILSVFVMSPTCHAHFIFLFCLRNNIWTVSHQICLLYFFFSSVLGQNIFFRIVILVSNAHYLRANINTNRFEFQDILILKSGQNSILAFLLLLPDTHRKKKNHQQIGLF